MKTSLSFKDKSGYSLIELSIAAAIMAMMSTFVMQVTSNAKMAEHSISKMASMIDLKNLVLRILDGQSCHATLAGKRFYKKDHDLGGKNFSVFDIGSLDGQGIHTSLWYGDPFGNKTKLKVIGEEDPKISDYPEFYKYGELKIKFIKLFFNNGVSSCRFGNYCAGEIEDIGELVIVGYDAKKPENQFVESYDYNFKLETDAKGLTSIKGCANFAPEEESELTTYTSSNPLNLEFASAASMQNITGLTQTLQPGKKYFVQFNGMFQSVDGGGSANVRYDLRFNLDGSQFFEAAEYQKYNVHSQHKANLTHSQIIETPDDGVAHTLSVQIDAHQDSDLDASNAKLLVIEL